MGKGQTETMPDQIAKDLSAAGLVDVAEEKQAPPVKNKMAAEPENKVAFSAKNK